MTDPVPSGALQAGLRCLRGVSGSEILGAPDLTAKTWALRTRLAIPSSSRHVPGASFWYVVIDAAYPLGRISVFPAKEGGITGTFPHQDRNEQGESDTPWRTGKLCLDSPLRALGFPYQNPDPIGDPDIRLAWHVERALQWLEAAASNTLVVDGDPFELPQYPRDPSRADRLVVIDESCDSFALWLGSAESTGFVVLDTSLLGPERLFVVGYETLQHRLLRSTPRYSEGAHGSGNLERRLGIWWRWPAPVVIEPWEVPATWGELRRVGDAQGVGVNEKLREISRLVRGNIPEPVLLVGFPIPRRQGEAAAEIHWSAIDFPTLTQEGRVPPGFRQNECGWWQKDRRGVFVDANAISYLQTVNWHPDRLLARGRLTESLRAEDVAIVGVGALGSAVAEILVRGGVKRLMLVDAGRLEAGNLARHTLTLREIGKSKAEAVRDRLASISPWVEVVAERGALPTDRESVEKLLEEYEVVIDCTASDEALAALALGWWSIPKLFLSLSLGYRAKRLFAYVSDDHRFPLDDFHSRISPWLDKEADEVNGEEEVLEGAGCWSPLFPAAYSDVLLAAIAGARLLEVHTESRPLASSLDIYEQQNDRGEVGLKPTELDVGAE